MESGDRLNIAFVETTLNESMLAEVGDLESTFMDEPARQDLRCSTPVLESDDQKEAKPSFDISCNVETITDVGVADICDAMVDINVKSK